MRLQNPPNTALNGICPYFTMFPLDFPYSILSQYAQSGDVILDPFCGRGTTSYASRILGLTSIGIDSSPVAVALSEAKIANTSPRHIIRAANSVLEEVASPTDVPQGEFWERAFHEDVLHTLCRLREGLLQDCRSDSRKALRAIVMGALHGPLTKTCDSYFSNQCQRTYAPKPRYAVKFWRDHGLVPRRVDVMAIIANRAHRYYPENPLHASGRIILGDSRERSSYAHIGKQRKIRWHITSPPYYGMRTYIPDQWLRMWFVGGSADVNYSSKNQLAHSSPDAFAAELRAVWRNTASVSASDARLIVRFGGINDRNVDPLSILRHSFADSGWQIEKEESAGSASAGRRQALHFSNVNKTPIEEFDVWARLEA